MDRHGIHTDRFDGEDDGPNRRADPGLLSRVQLVAPEARPVKATPAPTPSLPGIWSLHDAEVPELPALHPLERTAVFCENATASDITGRISGELRDRSIEAVYEQGKAKCTTSDGVDFRVKLFRGRGKFSQGIIVEVQRRFGVSTHFKDDTEAILKRAVGEKAPPRSKASSIPLVSEDPYEPDGSKSLVMVSKMLQPAGHDSQFLGLQTLASLTDEKKMGSSTATVICKELLRANNNVGAKVLGYIVAENGKDDDLFKLRTLALQVLTNTVTALKGDISVELREKVEPALIDALQNAQNNQRNAVLAAKCVEALLSKHGSGSGNWGSALQTAKGVGMERHKALERQAQKCLERLEVA